MLSNDTRRLIRLSLRGLGQDPEIDDAEGMGFQLDYESGLSLVLMFRGVLQKSFLRRVPRLYIALYQEVGEQVPVLHFRETMALPRGPSDMDFLMAFTPKIVAMTRAVADSSGAGRLHST